MASYWIEGVEGGYQILMTDGYLHPTAAVSRQSRQRSMPLEHVVAERLYREGKGKKSATVLDPLHVWVVGSPGWLSRRNRLALALSEGDQNPDYRAAIIGSRDRQIVPEAFHRWNRRLGRLGWAIKLHPDPQPYLLIAQLLLQDLVRRYLSTGSPSTRTFSEYGLPVAFCGDDY